MYSPVNTQAPVGLPGQALPSPGQPATGYPMFPPGAQASFRGAPKRPKVSNLTVSCPMLVGAMGPGLGFVPMPLTRLAVQAQCHISVAFVETTLECYFPQTWRAAPLQLYVPKSTSTVVSEVVVENLDRDQMYVTAIVPADDAVKGGYKASAAYGPTGQPQSDASSSSDPELFTLPLPGAGQPSERLRVRITTFEPLAFEEGSYVIRLPTEIPLAMIPEGYTVSQLLDVIVTINTGSPTKVKYDVRSGHRAVPGVQSLGTATLSFDKGPEIPNTDVEVGYLVWGSDMFLALNVTPPRPPHPADPDPRGAFVLTLAPPAPEYTSPFPRSIIFVLDRSGSMAGEPMEFAKSALSFGLRSLTPLDHFTVVAFDHEQLWFTPGGSLVQATQENVAACEAWVRGSISARGLTDIRGPLQTAMGVLSQRGGTPLPPAAAAAAAAGVTGGAADRLVALHIPGHGRMRAGREGHLSAGRAASGGTSAAEGAGGGGHSMGRGRGRGAPPPPGIPRIFTFGIGPYCNHYFLKQLATYGRGAFDVAFRPHAIQAQMQHMLTAAQRPVLSDLTLTLPGVTSAEMYPYPLPDLFCGMPLVVAGKYGGASWPAEGITLNGMLPNGAAWSSNPVLPGKDSDLPLDKVFIKNRLDTMTAQAWLAGNPPGLVGNIVDLSIATGVPCAHTRTVGFETSRKDYTAMQQAAASGGRRKLNVAKYAIGGAAGLVVLAGLGVGAAFAFGDVGATAANVGVGDALGGDLGAADMAGGDCCGGCGDCGDCGDCGECGNCGDCDGCGDALCDGLAGGDCTIS